MISKIIRKLKNNKLLNNEINKSMKYLIYNFLLNIIYIYNKIILLNVTLINIKSLI